MSSLLKILCNLTLHLLTAFYIAFFALDIENNSIRLFLNLFAFYLFFILYFSFYSAIINGIPSAISEGNEFNKKMHKANKLLCKLSPFIIFRTKK